MKSAKYIPQPPLSLPPIFLLCPHIAKGNKGALWSLFYEGPNPIYEGSTLMTQSPPEGPTTLGVRI